MKKTLLRAMAFLGLSESMTSKRKKSKMEINQRTGVVTLGSIFPSISKKVHRNGRRHNIDGRFRFVKFK